MSTDVPAPVSRPDHEQQILHLRRLVDVVRNVPQTIRGVFPVEGKAWPLKDHVATASIEVLNAMRYLEEMLYLPNQPESARQPERASEDAAARILTGPVQWKAYLNSILAIMCCHEPLWKHYQSVRHHQWADIIEAVVKNQDGVEVKNQDGTLKKVNVPVLRKQPTVPPIDAKLLDALEDAAVRLEQLVNDHQSRRDQSVTVAAKDEAVPVIQLVPAGFRWRGGLIELLTGKPLAMLRALVEAQDCRLSAATIREIVWPDDNATFPEQAIKDTASTLRQALRQALRRIGVKVPGDPLPSTGRGVDLTYQLDLSAIARR